VLAGMGWGYSVIWFRTVENGGELDLMFAICVKLAKLVGMVADSKKLSEHPPARVGLIGTGFIATGLLALLRAASDLNPTRVLSRRPPEAILEAARDLHTASLDELLENSDVVVECSGDVHHGANVVKAALEAGKPVVTMGTEFHVTVGSYFVGKGLLSEAGGDQPGSLALLREEAVEMGFRPLVFGNIKGFLNHYPTREDMEYWSKRQGISLAQVTSFTDGTKMQMEQALVANGLGANIARRGLLGPAGLDLKEGGHWLASRSEELGYPISDYLLNPDLPAGVFITAEHTIERPEVLRYLKMGDGPYYTLLRPYHLCHLEVPRTIRRILRDGRPLLNNGANPTITVCAVAKRDLEPGHIIEHAMGGMDVRGEATRIVDDRDAAPIGLLSGARITRKVGRDETLTLDAVELPDTFATSAWRSVQEASLARLANGD